MSTSAGSESSKGSKKTLVKSDQLESALKELESAFADWDHLGTPEARAAREAAAEQERLKNASAAAPVAEDDARTRTRELLHQLRDQLDKL
jgi:hypothetical protein